VVVLGHGSGGRLTADLRERVFLRAFDSRVLAGLEDAATVALPHEGRLAMTTDAFVVRPLFFPGGDIGKLAVSGTVNDLAVSGAEPRLVSAAFILEEGLPLQDLERVVASMSAACREAGVELVAGDTKVVECGKADGLFITTTGLGVVPHARELSISGARPGDRVITSGPLGDHGAAVIAAREQIDFETSLESDCAPLSELARALARAAPGLRCMRDPTRGGLSSALAEICAAACVGVVLDERSVPVRPEVRAVCELLAIDPLHMASAGRLVAVLAPEDEAAALDALRAHPLGEGACAIGQVVAAHPGLVILRGQDGGEKVVPVLDHETGALARVC
jgi:hydrogenase expression/formation protein HypE